jgi:dATP pyrophosphohydrolase
VAFGPSSGGYPPSPFQAGNVEQPQHYKRPESVLVVVYARTGQVLLLRRRQPPDFWQSVTGSLRWGAESPEQAARRELLEETGLRAGAELQATGVQNRFVILPAWRARYAPDVTHNLEHVFRLCLAAPTAIQLHPSEHTEYGWFSRDEALARASSSTNRAAIRALPLP